MLAKTYSAALVGIDAYSVEVEVNATGRGEAEYVAIVGLPDAAVRESRDRVRSALHSSGLFPPQGSVLVNLAPADIKKEGASFDLAIAVAMLGADNSVDRRKLTRTALLGELALDGSLRAVKGALPIAMHLSRSGEVDALLVPSFNADEAALAAGSFPVYAINHLSEAIDYFSGKDLVPYKSSLASGQLPHDSHYVDFAEVKGQIAAKRALEIAAAGGHNMLMIGPPGTGKSMLAKRLPSIMPNMTLDETLEVSKIHSIMGLLSDGNPLLDSRPFRSPHHTVSDAGLIGGGKNPTPGEISLAHNGVLFLDELPEFKRNVLEVLRQPLENGSINVARAAGNCTFPADFMLIAAMNPCPCGMLDPKKGCNCRPDQIKRYRAKISGPLLDRIDLHVDVPRLSDDELLQAPAGEDSASIRQRVVSARNIQRRRFRGSAIHCNSAMQSRELHKYCALDAACVSLLRHAINSFNLSPRAHDRILKCARTIADLANEEKINEEHLFEAVNYRSFDRNCR